MATITRKVILEWNGQSVTIPASLMKKEFGAEWLAVNGYHPAFITLLAGKKKGTLSECPGLMELKKLRNIAAGLASDPSTKPEAEALFAESEPSSKTKKKNKGASQQRSFDDVLEIDMNGQTVQVLNAQKSSDLVHIPMNEKDIDAVFQFVVERGVECEARAYETSGKYKKARN